MMVTPKDQLHRPLTATALILLAAAAAGCAAVGGTAMEGHRKGLESLAEDEYFTPKKPVDRHYIGSPWSRQFGPVEDPSAVEIRVKKERSLSSVQQDLAYNRGVSLGGESVVPGPRLGSVGVQAGGVQKSLLEGVEVIAPVSLADVPFEPGVPYVTEALRLANFRIKGEKSRQVDLDVGGAAPSAVARAALGGGGQSRTGTEGEGLVVAYKLHRIEPATYSKRESGLLALELDKPLSVPDANETMTARLRVIEPGADRSLPLNLLWACPRAEARSRDIAAAWLVEIRPLDPLRKSLTIAFPAYPRIEDCQGYSGILSGRIDPVTDRIVRQRLQVVVLQDELTETLQPARWDARVSLVDESFNVQLVKPSELEGSSR